MACIKPKFSINCAKVFSKSKNNPPVYLFNYLFLHCFSESRGPKKLFSANKSRNSSNKSGMTVNTDLISRLEHLARLELSEAERGSLQNDLSNILGMVEKLQELDTSKVEPLVYMNEEVNVWREDEVKYQVEREAALKNAPDQDGTFFKVPKVIDL
jgi:aspartyl-tRNA(Asn)/glutamyl-tRNA(Gln) amidotransferase subunit C